MKATRRKHRGNIEETCRKHGGIMKKKLRKHEGIMEETWRKYGPPAEWVNERFVISSVNFFFD